MNDLQIEYFLAVADNRSFTKTATEKCVSQPAISKQIAAMEEELGVTLFERTYKSVKLTEEGKLFSNFYKKQRQDLSKITQQAKDTNKQKKVVLRVGCGSGWSLTGFMPDLLKRLSVTNPEISILLESFNFSQLPTAVGDDQVDVVIALDSGFYATPSIEVRPFTEIPRVIVYSEHHPLAKKEQLQPSDFSDELFFIPFQDEATHIVELVKSFCKPYGFSPRIQGVNSAESLILCVLNGLGVAVTDLWTIESGRRGLCHISLNSSHVIVLAWKRNIDNPALPVFLRELEMIFSPDGGSFEPAL